jgi:hypothetical protein
MKRLLDGYLIQSTGAGGAGSLEPFGHKPSADVALLDGYFMEVPS